MLNAADAEGLDNFLSRQADAMGGTILSFDTVIDGWRVAGLLGRGGSGEVYRVVRDTETAALKILTKEGDAAKLRFAAEVEFLTDNKLTQFPRFISAGEVEGRPYVITELLEPVELPTDESGIADYLLSVCACVRSLHRAGIVHRDIKPRNIMRRSTGEIVLIDFGLAKNPSGDPLPRTDISVIAGRAVGVGTPGYAAPEQFTGGDITPASDIHALGVLAEKLLERGSGLLSASSWRRIIRSATSSIASERYQSVDEFAEAICHRNRVRQIAVGGIIVAIVLAAVFGFGYYWEHGGREQSEWNALGEQVVTNVVSQELVWERPVTNTPKHWAKGQTVVSMERAYRAVSNDVEVTLIRLNRGTNVFVRPLRLKEGREYWFAGPGVFDGAVTSEGTNSTVRLKDCVFLNRTTVPLERAGIRYVFQGGAYLNFTALDPIEDPMVRDRVERQKFVGIGGIGNNIRYRGPDSAKGLKRLIEEENDGLIRE